VLGQVWDELGCGSGHPAQPWQGRGLLSLKGSCSLCLMEQGFLNQKRFLFLSFKPEEVAVIVQCSKRALKACLNHLNWDVQGCRWEEVARMGLQQQRLGVPQ